MTRKVLYLLLICSFFISCSVQKRAHRKGYYVSWNHSSKSNGFKKSKEPTSKPKEEIVVTEVIKSNTEKMEASTGNPLISTETFSKPKLILADTCGDLIIMRNGTQVLAKVLEITDDKIKYKRCDNLEGPTIITSIDNVHTIKFVNGVSQSFELKAKQNNYEATPPSTNYHLQKTNPYAVAALVCAIVGVWPLSFLGSIFGLIFALKAEREINKNPERYKGKGLAIAAKVISIVMLVLLLIFLIILFALVL